MNGILEWLPAAGVYLVWGVVWLICLCGVLLSCLSLSGTWLVVLAALVVKGLRPGEFPGWWTITGFIAVSILVEMAEWGAGAWGVTRRGGSG